MEDYEDALPDSSGKLELSHLGWTQVDSHIFKFAHQLLTLDLAYNNLTDLPDELCTSLCLLSELNVACNKLSCLPKNVGTLQHLRAIKANGNNLTSLPSDIGRSVFSARIFCVNSLSEFKCGIYTRCTALETLNLSENILQSLPAELSGCSKLHTLKLQNNNLKGLPLELSSLCCLRDIDICNNKELTTSLPEAVHQDAPSILWILALRNEKRHQIETLKTVNKTLQYDIVSLKKDLDGAKDKVAHLEEKRTLLEGEMESVRCFLRVRSRIGLWRRELADMWEEATRRKPFK